MRMFGDQIKKSPGRGLLLPLLLLSLIPIMTFFLIPVKSLAADVGSRLLSGGAGLRSAAPAGTVTGRIMVLDTAVARAAASGAAGKLIIPVDGQDIEFHRKKSRARAKTTTWRGVDQEGVRSVLLTLGDDHLFGRVDGPDGVYVYRPGAGEREIVAYKLDPNYQVEQIDDFLVTDQAALEESPGSARIAQQVEDIAYASDDGSRIDVMVLYTDGMASAFPGSQIDTRIQYLIDVGNEVFSNSGISTQLNLVYSKQVSYTDNSPGDLEEALYDLTLNSGVFSGVENLRTEYGADQVTLLRRFVDEGCGVGWLHTSSAPDAAYTVVHDGDKTDKSGYYCDDYTYIHEIGHNLGCNHDRDNAGGIEGWYSYSYGYQDPSEAFRTVMAYDCPGGCDRVSYFSSPDLSYSGKPLGVDYTSAESADNVRTIGATKSVMAQYRADVSNYALSVSLAGVGTGSVSSSPSGISCGSDCTEQYDTGISVTLTATPDTGFIFKGWSGSCSGTGTCTLVMDQSHSVTAEFGYREFELSVSLTGTGSGSVSSSPSGISCGGDCAEQYIEGTTVTLTATTASDSVFRGWGGNCSGSGTCTLVMDQDYSVSAEFGEKIVVAPITLLLLR